METGGDRKRFRFFQQHISWRALAVGALGAAAFGVALLYNAGSAQAKPLDIPGLGQIEIPNEIPALDFGPLLVPGLAADSQFLVGVPNESGPAALPEAPQGHSQPALSAFEAAPGVLSVEEFAPAAHEVAPGIVPAVEIPWGTLSIEPTPAAAASMPEQVAPQADSRTITVAGLGTFTVPGGVPPLVGIPGVTDNPAPAAAPRQTAGERAVEAARSKLGTSYRMGGNGPDSFDCSGLVQWSYAEAGVELPRTSYGQLDAGTPVGLDELRPGDLVSFYDGGHSAIYAGDGQIIHASTYGVGVTESDLGSMPVSGARRF
ncbi:NlpC/P60 family protein [Nocardia sp. NPDC050406]|uniref:C40 family peptidase n=1 Tax=Nocardia sp. NPDC050406 TaxID=3364318 RepID=UPI0037B63DCB